MQALALCMGVILIGLVAASLETLPTPPTSEEENALERAAWEENGDLLLEHAGLPRGVMLKSGQAEHDNSRSETEGFRAPPSTLRVGKHDDLSDALKVVEQTTGLKLTSSAGEVKETTTTLHPLNPKPVRSKHVRKKMLRVKGSDHAKSRPTVMPTYSSFLFFGKLSKHLYSIRRPADIDELSRLIKKSKNKHETDGIKLVASPSVIDDRGQNIEVIYSGLTSVGKDDFIAVYCNQPDVTSRGYGDYLDAQNVFAGATKDKQGKYHGLIEAEDVINMRCDYQFRLISGSTYHILAESNIVKTRGGHHAPMQGRLALTGDASEMRIMWTSQSSGNPVVIYGTKSGVYPHTVTGTSDTFSGSDLCSGPANFTAQAYFRDPGFQHSAVMTGLQHNTRYYYRFGSTEDGLSREYYFKSARSPGSRDPVSFVAYADMGIGQPPSAMSTAANAYHEAMLNGYDDFLLHVGDLSYALGNSWMWEYWMQMIEPVATRTPYMVAIGNHEYCHTSGGQKDPSHVNAEGGWHPEFVDSKMMRDDSFGECGVPTVRRFTMPSNGNGLFWYSFEYGLVKVISMSTEHNWLPGSEQYTWLELELSHIDRDRFPWVILMAHRPPYMSSETLKRDRVLADHLRAALDPLLFKYQVNMMITGHNHQYERTCAVVNGKCQPAGKGTVHFVVGTAGAGLERGLFNDTFSVSHVNAWGYIRVRANPPPQTLDVQFVTNANNAIFDEVSIPPFKH